MIAAPDAAHQRAQPWPAIDAVDGAAAMPLRFRGEHQVVQVADAGFGARVPEGQEHRWGTFIGAGLGGVRTIEDTYAASKVKGPRHGISPYFVYSENAAQTESNFWVGAVVN